MESGRWMDSFCHSMQRQEDSPPATDCRLGDGPRISIHVLFAERDRGFSAPSAGRGWNFNRRSPYGERRCRWASRRADICHFNPRSPHGERLNAPTPRNTRILFQSTLSSRRATWPDDVGGGMIGISIHALLTESDKAGRVGRPHVGPFQSTLSSRRATANTTKLALSFLSKVPI